MYKAMLILELLDQYEDICRRAFFSCAAKLNKTFKTNIIEILILIMCIARKIIFLQLGCCGWRSEQRCRQTFRKDSDKQCFNMNLAALSASPCAASPRGAAAVARHRHGGMVGKR